ncbi:MAG: hypothetical protein EBS16_03850 [Betaproteobacteria bacterium]|nr:hypothetical protein [Betaproteobacteria bacterium]
MSRLNRSLRTRRPTAFGQRGGALLITVLGLSVATLVGLLYASRSLATEQRSSLMQWRAAQAAQAAEAGLEWTLAALNAGRLSSSCRPTADASASTLAQRWWQENTSSGSATSAQRAGCLLQDSSWICRCPTSASVATEPRSGGPAFEVHAQTSQAVNTLRLQSVGCSTASDSCLRSGVALAPDAAASVSRVVGRVPHLRVQPNAAVTVTQDVRLSAPAGLSWNVSTAQTPASSAAMRAGGVVQGDNASLQALRSDGSPAPVITQDAWLMASALASPERRFATWMGLAPKAFQQLTSVTSLSCPSQGCADALLSAVALRPGATVWVRGTLRLERSVSVGSTMEPVLIVAEEGLALDTPASQITGVVVLPALPSADSGTVASAFIRGSGSIQGALVCLGTLAGPTDQAWPAVRHDPDVVARVLTDRGEWVRVPGGWRDF